MFIQIHPNPSFLVPSCSCRPRTAASDAKLAMLDVQGSAGLGWGNTFGKVTLDRLHFQRVFKIEVDLCFGGFSTTGRKRQQTYCNQWIVKTWWTWQIYFCMPDLEDDVLIHIGYVGSIYTYIGDFVTSVAAYSPQKHMSRWCLDRTLDPILGYLKSPNDNGTEWGSDFGEIPP